MRVIAVFGGFALLTAGIAMLALPGPGWLAIVGGLAILAREFTWAERLLDRLKTTGRRFRPVSKKETR